MIDDSEALDVEIISNSSVPRVASNKTNSERVSSPAKDLLIISNKIINKELTDEDSINFIDTNLIDNLQTFNLKLAEVAMGNLARLINTLDIMIDNMIERIEQTPPENLSDEVLSMRCAFVFELMTRYQAFMTDVTTRESYVYYLDNLQSIQRSYENKKKGNSGLYENKSAKKILKSGFMNIKEILNSNSETYNQI